MSDAGLGGRITIKDVHFVKRLTVFGHKTDRHEHKLRHAFAREFWNRDVRRGSEPFDRTDLALKRERVRTMRSESFHHKLNCSFGLIQVRIAFGDVSNRHAVRAEKNVCLRRVLIWKQREFFERGGCHCVYVIRVCFIATDYRCWRQPMTCLFGDGVHAIQTRARS